MADYSDIVKAYAEAIQGAEVAALNRIGGLMKSRIHNKGGNTEGGKIGDYTSASWIKKRKSKGRQVAYVDLEFEGDLRTGYGIGTTEDNANCLGFYSDFIQERSAKMERLYGTVFFPSETELDDGSKQYDIVFDQQVRDALRD